MAINLELPKKLQAVIEKGHQGAAEMLRPISRKYDSKEHAYPVELDTIATLFEGISEAKTISFAGAEAFRDGADGPKGNINGGNMSAVLNIIEVSWGDVGLVLSIPFQGLGNAAISGVATDEQLERLGKVWAAMAITEPGFGSDSAAVSTTAVLDGDDYVINGEKIYVTAGSRATHIVVWATLDKTKGRAAIKSFIVPTRAPRRHGRERSRTSSASRPPTPQRSGSTMSAFPGTTCWAARISTWRRVLPGSWRPSTTPGPSWRAWPSASHGPRSRSFARSSPVQVSRSPMTNRRMPRAPRPRSSCGWRPTGSPAIY